MSAFVAKLSSQTGGRNVFQFINLAPSARIGAMGGMALGWKGNDPTAAYQNPALLNESNHTQLSFNHQFYFADIKVGHFSYSHSLDSLGLNLQWGVQYANYGEIPRTDVNGNEQGTFPSYETNIFVIASKTFNERISLGASVQWVNSLLDVYKSQGLACNLAAHYFNPQEKFGLSLVVKNLGFQFQKYYRTSENFPFEIQLGFAKRLRHLPFTYHIGFRNLERWNLLYDDPDLSLAGSLFGGKTEKTALEQVVGNFFRHFVFGGELSIGKRENLTLRLGYNHLRNRDLNVPEYRSFSGLSVGFGVKIYKFRLDYSYARYHIAGGTNQLSITTDLNAFLRKEL